LAPKFSNIQTNNINESAKIRGHSDDIINTCVITFKNLLIWLEIKTLTHININESTLRLFFFNILIILAQAGKIEKINIMLNSKTYSFYLFNTKEIHKKYKINISFWPYLIHKRENNELFIYAHHYSTINRIFKENIFSGSQVYLSEKSNILEKLCNS
jgi:hypothetical protein